MQYPYDLFGEVPVTLDDVRLWVASIPRLDPDSPQGQRYAKSWNVADKIRRAKVAGWFDQVKPPPAFSHDRLRW